jgi:hypothetical protein
VTLYDERAKVRPFANQSQRQARLVEPNHLIDLTVGRWVGPQAYTSLPQVLRDRASVDAELGR